MSLEKLQKQRSVGRSSVMEQANVKLHLECQAKID